MDPIHSELYRLMLNMRDAGASYSVSDTEDMIIDSILSDYELYKNRFVNILRKNGIWPSVFDEFYREMISLPIDEICYDTLKLDCAHKLLIDHGKKIKEEIIDYYAEDYWEKIKNKERIYDFFDFIDLIYGKNKQINYMVDMAMKDQMGIANRLRETLGVIFKLILRNLIYSDHFDKKFINKFIKDKRV